jgi:dynactin complex subunit
MKYLVIAILFWGCVPAIANKESDNLQKEKEFEKLMSRVSKTNELSIKVQEAASKKEAEMVKKAVETITTLKQENKELKLELNETKARLDSVSIDTLIPFSISPISSKKDI